MEANFSVEEAACTCYAAKPLTFLPERRILFAWLAINNRKGGLHDARHILEDVLPYRIVIVL